MVLSAANPPSLIDLRLLGPLTVTVDGQPVAIGGPRQMAVLARLMLTPDQVVTMSQLVESVWDGDEPAQPHVAVRSYISNLRRAIEPNRQRRSTDSCLASAPPGYRLAIDPGSVDWVRFERLVNQGRQHLAVDDPGSAVDALREAHALWLGIPCSGLPESQFFVAHQARLTELRETAVELMFEALLAQGDHGSVAAEVESAIAESPLRERLTELGMLAFYQSGRQSEALALGQRLKTRLLDKLGVDPSPSIDAIELKILNHDRSLEPEPRTERPAANGAGQAPPTTEPKRPEYPGPTPPADPAAVSPGSTYRGQQPPVVEPSRPIGRDAELETLRAIDRSLATGRSTTAIITGEQGIGKTTLARWVADDLDKQLASVAWARSIAGETPPLWPWAQAVLALLDRPGTTRRAEITADLSPLTALGPSVAAALGLASDHRPAKPTKPVSGEVPDSGLRSNAEPWTISHTDTAATPATGYEQPELMLAITRLLEQLASVDPIVLIFEDLHWADRQSIALINYAAASLADSPVGFVLTWRETDLAADETAAALRALSRLPTMVRIELQGLDEAAIGRLAQDAGYSLSRDEADSLHRRSDGNPLFVKEMLSWTDLTMSDGRPHSTLVDTVIDRVERLHPSARSVLSAAALFRTPFTIEAVQPICDADGEQHDAVQDVLNAAVLAAVLREVDPTAGSYAFRQPLMADVLASGLLAVDRSQKHEAIGHYLLKTDGLSFEVAHHLSNSRSPADRLLAARAAIVLFQRGADSRRLTEIDRYVDIGANAVEQLRDRDGPIAKEFGIDALHYRSWRASVDGRPNEWLAYARLGLKRALERNASAANGRNLPRGKPAQKSTEPRRPNWEIEVGTETVDRLERAMANMIGSPFQSLGASRTAGFAELGSDDINDLSEAMEQVGADSSVKWATQIHLGHLTAQGRPGLSGQTKAVREAVKTATAARRRLGPQDTALVLRVLIARFSEGMEPKSRLSMLADIETLDPGRRTDVFVARYAYPAMLELGRTYQAELQTEAALSGAMDSGDPFLIAEARLLWIRHLLWTGQLDVADDELDQAFADWRALGLAEAVPLVRQRRTIRLLRRVPLGEGHGPDSHHQLLVDRVAAPELAMRLARLGDERRATEVLESLMESVGVRHLSLPDQALIAAAAGLVGHEKAALTVYDQLLAHGDQPVARADGSVILGPASLYAGLAALAAGHENEAPALFDSGMRAVQRFGGSPASLDALVSAMGAQRNSNRLPTNP